VERLAHQPAVGRRGAPRVERLLLLAGQSIARVDRAVEFRERFSATVRAFDGVANLRADSLRPALRFELAPDCSSHGPSSLLSASGSGCCSI
jgi:hypothetical protein